MTVAVAFDRFGLGATPGAIAPADPRGWVTAQLDHYLVRPAPIAAAPSTASAAPPIARFLEQRREIKAATRRDRATKAGAAAADDPMVAEIRRRYTASARDAYSSSVAARFDAALGSETPFVERLVHFWANHFAVSADKVPVRALAGPFEFEAIRPHVLGTFGGMLAAVERHPAMLLYLDQAVSVGPNSEIARHAGTKKLGLNENLAREIIELHTLGVRTGYSQTDVTEFARAMTGWSVAGLAPRTMPGHPGAFQFAERLHEPGARTIIGATYRAGGVEQGQAVLDALARHPATATHIATKLTRHFAGDPVPPAMVDRVASAFRASDGDLPTVYRAIVASPEAWVDRPVRFRTPWDWAVATLRAIGQKTIEPGAAVGLMNQLGQPVWKPGQPSGWDDMDGTWAAADAVLRRVEAADRLAGRATAPVDGRRLAGVLHPGGSSQTTAQAVARAESPAQALALLLVAPEAMRR